MAQSARIKAKIEEHLLDLCDDFGLDRHSRDPIVHDKVMSLFSALQWIADDISNLWLAERRAK